MSTSKGVSQRLTPEQIREVEDTQDKYEESLSEFAKATLWQLMRTRGMDTQKAREIRVRAGATQ
jgi:uncharacterized protein YbaP (TraB family)